MSFYGSIYSTITYHAWLENSNNSITIKRYEFDGENYGVGFYEDVSNVKAGHHNKTRVQMRKENDYTVLSEEEADRARAVDIMVMATQKPHVVEMEKIVRGGKTIWYRTTVTPIVDRDRISHGTICESQDITKRVIAEERSKRLLRFLVRRLDAPLVALMPVVRTLGPEHSKLKQMLEEMLVRVKRIQQNI